MTVTVRHGNLGIAATNITSAVRLPGGDATAWRLVEQAEKGAASLSGFSVEDPSDLISLIGLKEVHVEDTGCTEPTVFAGFWETRKIGRAAALRTGSEREWNASTTDLNVLLNDYVITSGNRPAETDINRIDWLLASGFCPLGDAGIIDRSGPVSLPACDYAGRFASDVLAEASNLSDKNYFVRWEQACSFADCYSPWAPPKVSNYTAPVGMGYSSVDILGGKFRSGIWPFYDPAASVYPSTNSVSATNTLYGSNQPDPNTGAAFGVGTPDVQVAYYGGSSTSCRWTWDLNAAGLPTVATIGLIEWIRQGALGYPGLASFSIEYSDNGTDWHLLFDQSDISAGLVGPPDNWTSILNVPGCQGIHRYWSLVMVGSAPEVTAFGFYASGFMLWGVAGDASTGPGPALGYHETNWSGDLASIAISNVLSDVDGSTVFAPGEVDGLTRDPSRVYSGCWFEFSGGHVYVPNLTTEGNFRHRDVRASDLNCKSATAASDLANAFLGRCTTEEDRFTVTLHAVPAASVNLARPGQSIDILLSHVPNYEAGASMGIVRREIAPEAYGLYEMILELAVPKLTGFHPADALNPTTFGRNFGLVVSPAPTPTTGTHGQTVPPTVVGTGDGVTVLFTLGSAYLTGSVHVWVDEVQVAQASIAETSPVAGTITLDFAPAGASTSATAETVTASWQVD
jgi:hypothetical protein